MYQIKKSKEKGIAYIHIDLKYSYYTAKITAEHNLFLKASCVYLPYNTERGCSESTTLTITPNAKYT